MIGKGLTTLIGAAAVMAATVQAPATAADFGGNCCADLEERIAELEATTARKGNRKVSLTIYGNVNQSILFWDDEHENNQYIGTNGGYPSFFGFTGDATIAPGWKAGYVLEVWPGDNYSFGYTQDSDEAFSTPIIWKSNWYVESEKYGKLAVGINSRVSDLSMEQDLSNTTDASYSLVSDIGFSFNLRRADGVQSGLAQGFVSGYSFTGETASIIRYDSPTFAGFTFAASWGEDDMTDVGLFYSHEGGGFEIAAGVSYAHVTDENGIAGFADFPGPPIPDPLAERLETDTVAGSISVLHQSSGLNATVAAGHRSFGNGIADTDNQLGLTTDLVSPKDTSYIWVKLGWIAKMNKLGDTAFYGEYGWYKDGVSAGWDATTIGSLSAAGVDADCAAAGNACKFAGSDAEIWGLGVVQHIDAAEMAFYLGYRHWSADVDIVDVNGDPVAAANIEDFQSLIAGARISF